MRWLPALALAVGACQSESHLYDVQGPRYEARAWLAGNANPSPFASNRFETQAAGAAFIDSLYVLGADTVYMVNVEQDSAWVQEEGGPYSDALLIRLPADPAARARLFAVNAREEGLDPETDHGQQYLFFWWD